MSIKSLKVLNIAQPHAHCVIYKGKNIENRSRPVNFRGTIAIYGSKTFNPDRFESQDLVTKEECSFGTVIGLVDLVDCIDETEVTTETEEWFMGPYGYKFENVVVLKKPVEVSPPKGAIIWWPLEGDALSAVLSQVDSSKILPITEVSKEEIKARQEKRLKARKSPSKDLSAIIGSERVTLNEALWSIVDYIEDNELFTSTDDEDDEIHPDKKLLKILGKEKVYASEVKELLKAHLE